jgi:hypothetical protein
MKSSILKEIRNLQQVSDRELKGGQVLSEFGEYLAHGRVRFLADSKESRYVSILFYPDCEDVLGNIEMHAGWLLYGEEKIPISERQGVRIIENRCAHLELDVQHLLGDN